MKTYWSYSALFKPNALWAKLYDFIVWMSYALYFRTNTTPPLCPNCFIYGVPCLFFFIFIFSTTNKIKVLYKYCWWLYSNPGPLLCQLWLNHCVPMMRILHCVADLLFYRFGFSSFAYIQLVNRFIWLVESKPVKQEDTSPYKASECSLSHLENFDQAYRESLH